MSITLEITKDKELWNKLVEKSPHGTLFHTWKFLKIVEKHTNSKLYPIIGMKGTTPVGIYPLFLQKKFFLRLVFSPPPHVAVPYLGPAFIDYDKLKQSKKESIFVEFQEEVDEFLEYELSADYVSVYTPPNLPDSRPFRWSNYNIAPLYGYITKLNKDYNHIWKKLKKNLRRSIKKTKERGNVTISDGSKHELNILYELLTERYRVQGKVVKVSKDYLIDVFNLLHPNNMEIVIATYNNEIVTGVINLLYKSRLSSWIGSPKPNLMGIGVTDLVHWEIIKNACKRGLKEYEEVGAGTERLCKYKSKFNPELFVHFSCKRYISIKSNLAESLYFNILKPVHTKIKLLKSSSK